MSSTSWGPAISAVGAAGMWGLFLPSSSAGSACPVHLGVRPSVLLEPLVCGVFFFPLPPNADSACPVHQLSGDGFQLQQPVKA